MPLTTGVDGVTPEAGFLDGGQGKLVSFGVGYDTQDHRNTFSDRLSEFLRLIEWSSYVLSPNNRQQR